MKTNLSLATLRTGLSANAVILDYTLANKNFEVFSTQVSPNGILTLVGRLHNYEQVSSIEGIGLDIDDRINPEFIERASPDQLEVVKVKDWPWSKPKEVTRIKDGSMISISSKDIIIKTSSWTIIENDPKERTY